MSLSYAYEKYRLAVESMALGEGPLRGRLRTAFRHHASLAHPLEGGGGRPVPNELRVRLEELYDRLNRIEPDTGIASIGGAIELLEDEEVRDTAAELVSIADALGRAHLTP